MTKKQPDQEPMQQQPPLESSLPVVDRVALTADELKESITVEEVSPVADERLNETPEQKQWWLDKEAEKLAQNPKSADDFAPEIPDVVEEKKADKDQTMAEMRVAMMEEMRKEMMPEIKKELLKDLASEHEQKLAMAQEERDRNTKDRAAYVAKMKNSSEPWVDWVSAISDENGVGMELDWNDAYVDFLRANGVTGADDDAIVHKYVTLLLRQGADAIDEEFEDKSKYEG